MEFNTSSDLPFTLRGGNDMNTVLANRVAAINRINYLVRLKFPEFDIREKSQTYKDFLDLELWKKYYSNEPTKPIDEDFCQRCAELCTELEKEDIVVVDKEEFNKVAEEIKKPVNKGNFIQRFLGKR